MSKAGVRNGRQEWRCKTRQAEADKRYAKTEAGRLNKRKHHKRYIKTDKGRAVQKRAVQKYARGKGYVTRRRWTLLRERERVINQLEVLRGSKP